MQQYTPAANSRDLIVATVHNERLHFDERFTALLKLIRTDSKTNNHIKKHGTK